MRRKLVVGNWKMYGRLAGNQALLQGILDGVRQLHNADYAVCVPYPYLAQAQSMLQGSNVAWGAQNLNPQEEGAFTGAVAPGMLVDFGCRYVIIGHSERRGLFHESNEMAAAKFEAAQRAGLTPIFCVGETLIERESGVTEQVVATQLDAVLTRFGAAALSKAVIAYEPVWAIGTGKTASPSANPRRPTPASPGCRARPRHCRSWKSAQPRRCRACRCAWRARSADAGRMRSP